jgi:hypothetical protein
MTGRSFVEFGFGNCCADAREFPTETPASMTADAKTIRVHRSISPPQTIVPN